MEKITKNHYQNNEGNSADLLLKLGSFFIDFAKEDFFRFQLMFLYTPPKTTDPGPFELQCNPNSLSGLLQVCDAVIKEEQLKDISPVKLAIQMLSLVLGFSVLISPINDYLFKQKPLEDIRTKSYKKNFLESSIRTTLKYYR